MQAPPRRRYARTMIVGVSLLALLAGGCADPAAPAAAPTAPPSPVHAVTIADRPTLTGTTTVAGTRCGRYRLPVHLGSPRPEIYADQLGVQLCARSGYADHPVQLLVPDAGDDQRSWQWPAPATSWVSTALRARPGWVTASVEPFGAGEATRPPGGWVTADQMADALHQLITHLRGGDFGVLFGRVVAVGQGTGGYLAAIEAGRWHDVAGLVLFGAAPDGTGQDRTPPASVDAGNGYRRLTGAARCAGIDPAGAVAGRAAARRPWVWRRRRR
jgi:hypothetical protein